jgi:hypothetical protein
MVLVALMVCNFAPPLAPTEVPVPGPGFCILRSSLQCCVDAVTLTTLVTVFPFVPSAAVVCCVSKFFNGGRPCAFRALFMSDSPSLAFKAGKPCAAREAFIVASGDDPREALVALPDAPSWVSPRMDLFAAPLAPVFLLVPFGLLVPLGLLVLSDLLSLVVLLVAFVLVVLLLVFVLVVLVVLPFPVVLLLLLLVVLPVFGLFGGAGGGGTTDFCGGGATTGGGAAAAATDRPLGAMNGPADDPPAEGAAIG